MKEEIFQEALRIVQQRRMQAVTENERRYAHINASIPQIAEINARLAQTASRVLSLAQDGQAEQQIAALRRENEEAQRISAGLLTANGYPADYLDIRYHCPVCGDTGYADGQMCECLRREIAGVSTRRMNRDAQLALCDFSQFSLEYYRGLQTEDGRDCYQVMARILQGCRSYAREFSTASPSLLFFGKTGRGKTHLSLAIAKEVLAAGHDVVYDSVINLLGQVEREHFSRSRQETDTLDTLLRTELLILDDMGTEFDTPFYVSVVYNIINTRLNRGLPTIISTNLGPHEIRQRYEERIVSRLFAAYESMHVEGKDIRLLKKQQEDGIL